MEIKPKEKDVAPLVIIRLNRKLWKILNEQFII